MNGIHACRSRVVRPVRLSRRVDLSKMAALDLGHAWDRHKLVFERHQRSVERAARGDRPQSFDAFAAEADEPVVEIDRRV